MTTMTVLYVASVFTGTQTSLLSPVLSVTIGATIGVLVRYIAGRANEQPGGSRIAAELARQGGNVARCAEALKIAKTTLHDKIKRHGL